MKTLRSGEVGRRLAGLGGAADFHAEVVGIEKPSMRPEKVPEEAKEEERSLRTGLWGQDGDEGEEENSRRLRLMQEASGSQVKTSSRGRVSVLRK